MRVAIGVLGGVLVACAPRGPATPVTPPTEPARAAGPTKPAVEAAAETEARAELGGPGPAVAAAPAGTMRRVVGVEVAQLGEAQPGFVWWLSANARLAAIYRFKETPRFGHHGEPMGAAPTLTLFDTSTGAGETIDELVATDPRGRHAVILGGGTLWLVDSETGQREDLTARGADAGADDNRCLPPRQAGFDALGGQLVYMRGGPERAVIRRLADGAETEVPAGPGRLWRAQAVGEANAALLFEVPRDSDGDGKIGLPRQNTSCACRWCGRFALSHGFYGWSGDAFEFVMVEGSQRTKLTAPLERVGPGVFADSDAGTLQRADGQKIAAPAGCDRLEVLAGSPAVLAACGATSRVFWPATGATAPLPVLAPAIAGSVVRAADGRLRVGVLLRDSDPQLASVDLTDGKHVDGPVVTVAGAADRRGRVLTHREGRLVAFDVATGGTRALADRKALDVGRGWARVDDAPHAVDAGRGLLHALPDTPVYPAENGCALVAARRQDELEIGPWALRCPGPADAP